MRMQESEAAMFKKPTIEHAQRMLRVKVCATCPFRTLPRRSCKACTPLPCEQVCPLFNHLPTVIEIAGQMDPMVGNRPRLVSNVLRTIDARARLDDLKAKRHERLVVRTIDDLFVD